MVNSLLRYYMHVPDPDALDDETWGECYAHLQIIRQKEKEAS